MKSYSEKNDETLVELTLLGDDSAFEELVLRHQRAVMGTAYKVTNNTHSAEDASQDAFVSAFINLPALRDPTKFGPWVCSIAGNCARTLNAHYRSAIPDISFDLLFSEDTEDNGSEIQYEETAELHEAVETLGEKIRETIKLHYFEDMSVSEIAKKLSVSVGTVKWRLSEGRKQLRKGYGIVEKSYNENEALVRKVMRQVENLKLWKLKNNKKGFEEEYRSVLNSVEELPKSKEKNLMLAETLVLGYWFIPEKNNDGMLKRIKAAAELSHNDEVMRTVASHEFNKLSGDEKIDFILNKQIPYYRENGYPKTLAYLWFWLGYEYRKIDKTEKAIDCFKEVMSTVPPTDVYYANAKSAIGVEERYLKAKAENAGERHRCSWDTTGELYKISGNNIFFWEQPGYGNSHINYAINNAIFWNTSCCDSLILACDMKPGDKKTSSDGKITFSLIREDGVCETPAGRFEKCRVYVSEGEKYGLTYCETWFCENFGIVRQKVTRYGGTAEWLLSGYCMNGGKGLLPFAVGNRWEFSLVSDNDVYIRKIENTFEVTGMKKDTVTVSSMFFGNVTGYSDTWEGNILKARENYFIEKKPNGEGKLAEVRPSLRRAAELAETKRQKTHTAVAIAVMDRIFVTDPEFNPDYTEKGRWNFFEYDELVKNNGRIILNDIRKYSFELKDMDNSGKEGNKVLYTFFLTILQDAAECIWSDEWTDGYCCGEKTVGKFKVKDFKVKEGENAVTPAGNFTDCLCVSFDYSAWGYFSGKSSYWYAPGVGIVKYRHISGQGEETVWYLTAYKGTGKGYFPTDNGLFRRYEPESSGDGWHGSLEYTFDTDQSGTVMFKNALGTQDRENYTKNLKK